MGDDNNQFDNPSRVGQIENVIVVVVDALRADRVGAIGGGDLTPNIDSVAESGAFFTNAYTCSPTTDASVTAINTGQYPLSTVYHHGKLVTDDEKRRVESVPTLPQLLQSEGIHTIAEGHSLGRWHDRGFDRYPELEVDQQNRVVKKLSQMGLKGYQWVRENYPVVADFIRDTYQELSDDVQFTNRNYDPTLLLDRKDRTPFFGFIHLMDTHFPYRASEEDIQELLKKKEYEFEELEELYAQRELTDTQIDRIEGSLDIHDATHLDTLLAHYDATVMSADRKIGKLVSELRERNLYDETALFIMSDHGEALLEHNVLLDHHTLHDPVMHIPLITNIESDNGNQIEHFIQQIDIAPTILDILDIGSEPLMDGQSFWPLLRGDGNDWERRRAVFAEEAYTQRSVAIRTNEWKYIRYLDDEKLSEERGDSMVCGYCETEHGDRQQLFNLRKDPGEVNNVLRDNEQVAEDLWGLYQDFLTDVSDVDKKERLVEYDDEEEVFDRLESLGYR